MVKVEPAINLPYKHSQHSNATHHLTSIHDAPTLWPQSAWRTSRLVNFLQTWREFSVYSVSGALSGTVSYLLALVGTPEPLSNKSWHFSWSCSFDGPQVVQPEILRWYSTLNLNYYNSEAANLCFSLCYSSCWPALTFPPQDSDIQPQQPSGWTKSSQSLCFCVCSWSLHSLSCSFLLHAWR